MTATDEPLPLTAEDSHPSLSVEETMAHTDESHPENSQPTATLEHPQTSPNVPSVNGGHNRSEAPEDPKVAALLSMFPDFDTSLLQSVLESVAGDQDRAVDVLLGMSDPSYTSTERADLVRLLSEWPRIPCS
jgi:CUE domain